VADRLTLEIPADAAYMAAARLFSAAVARHYAVDEHLIPDVKLAVSEACAAGILLGGESSVRIAAVADGDRVRFEVTQPEGLEGAALQGDQPATPDPHQTAELGLEVIRALFEDADVVAGPDGGKVVRFAAPVGAF
jgi:anti-sigma regulatory factor (Ser/Thr protein kinase)